MQSWDSNLGSAAAEFAYLNVMPSRKVEKNLAKDQLLGPQNREV